MKKLLSIIFGFILLFAISNVYALNITGSPMFQALDGNGVPLAGGYLYTYEVGTTTAKAAYQDYAGVASHTNPIVLDSRGEAEIWWNGPYKLVLKDADGTTIWTIDNFGSGKYYDTASASSGYIAISHDSGTSEIRFVATISGNSVEITDLDIRKIEASTVRSGVSPMVGGAGSSVVSGTSLAQDAYGTFIINNTGNWAEYGLHPIAGVSAAYVKFMQDASGGGITIYTSGSTEPFHGYGGLSGTSYLHLQPGNPWESALLWPIKISGTCAYWYVEEVGSWDAN